MLALRKLNSHGIAHLFMLLLVVVVVGIAGAYYLVSSRAETISFTYLGTHPQAAAQPTTNGKKLVTLQGFNNKVYAGFGDYGANTGPIAVTPFDLSANSFAATPELVQNTQMIGVYRIINSKLYSPCIDNRNCNYAVGEATSGSTTWKEFAWRTSAAIPHMIHVFDMNTSNGTDLWMAGSSNQDAVLHRSTDGGATWVEMQRIVGDSTTYHRFYGIVTLAGKVYVQPFKVTNGSVQPAGSSRMWSNGSWSTGPKLTTGYNVWHPVEFAGKSVYFNWALVDGVSPQCLTVFNGSSLSSSCPSGVTFTDYSVVGDTLYALSLYDLKVYSTKDLVNWYVQGTVPSGSTSVTAYNGKIYVGTVDSKLYSAPINSSPAPAGTSSGGTSGGSTCTGKKCGGNPGGGPSGCNGKKCQTADGATTQ